MICITYKVDLFKHWTRMGPFRPKVSMNLSGQSISQISHTQNTEKLNYSEDFSSMCLFM